jgi:hypothetical protein
MRPAASFDTTKMHPAQRSRTEAGLRAIVLLRFLGHLVRCYELPLSSDLEKDFPFPKVLGLSRKGFCFFGATLAFVCCHDPVVANAGSERKKKVPMDQKDQREFSKGTSGFGEGPVPASRHTPGSEAESSRIRCVAYPTEGLRPGPRATRRRTATANGDQRRIEATPAGRARWGTGTGRPKVPLA